MLQQQRDGHGRKSGDMQARLPSTVLLPGLPPEGAGHIEGESSCLKSSDQENPLQEGTAACVLVDSRCNRADSQS